MSTVLVEHKTLPQKFVYGTTGLSITFGQDNMSFTHFDPERLEDVTDVYSYEHYTINKDYQPIELEEWNQ